MRRVVLIHGAATTAAIWDQVAARLAGRYDVVAPERRCSGSWEKELDDLEAVCAGSMVVGVSGGATLALGLAARDLDAIGFVAHEPAAGSLAPRLLDHATAGMREGGVAGFGNALYGCSWNTDDAPEDPEAVRRDLAMFRTFEPVAPPHPFDTMLVTVGELSPRIRHRSVAAVAGLLGAQVTTVPGASHAVHLDAAEQFARVIESHVAAHG